MGRIDQQTVNRIFDAADIVEVVGDYVELRRRGANYMGLCPFHNERTPSFSVSRAKGICKCFSCGKGGNAVNFLMEIEQISYGEALRRLAKKYGIEIQETEMTDQERERRQQRESLFAIVGFAADFFAQTLAASDDAMAWFNELSIDKPTLSRYNFGILPQGDQLRQAAAKAGFSRDVIASANLDFAKAEEFEGIAIVAPIGNHYGKTIGFRVFDSRNPQNHFDVGPETLFQPQDALFGFHQARQSMSRSSSAVIANDPIEAAVASAAGVSNCVSTLVPTISETVASTLKKVVENATFILPRPLKWRGYETMRGALPLLRTGIGTKVVTFPAGENFMKFAAGHTSPEITAHLDSAETDMVMFKLDNLAKVAHDASLKQYESTMADDFYTTLAAVGDSIRREIYVSEASRRLNLKTATIEKAIKSHSQV